MCKRDDCVWNKNPRLRFVDKSDPDREPQTYYLDDFFVEGRFGWYFFPSNTTLQVENGVAVSMERVYIP